MIPDKYRASLEQRLPPVRGEMVACAPISRFTWFKTGGPAEFMFRPADEADLEEFLEEIPDDVEITVIGNASNLLVRDGGVDGVVIRLGRAFGETQAEGLDIVAGGACANLNIARCACDAGIAGFEFLAGVPGTLGGGIFMNAGAYGAEMSELLVEARVLSRGGITQYRSAADTDFSYRTSSLGQEDIIVAARLRGWAGDVREISKKITLIRNLREKSQPVRSMTGGSTFKNPQGHKAWQLIEAAGCRGLRIGCAAVSEKHCNFLINQGGASSADLESLGKEIRRRVQAHSGIILEWEIRRIGKPAGTFKEELVS